MTPLFKKLNHKTGTTILCLNAPAEVEGELDAMRLYAPVVTQDKSLRHIDFALIFTRTLQEVNRYITLVHPKLTDDAVLWFCYPKGTSKKYTCEFNRDTGWEKVHAFGFEPVRAVSIDEDWSALRFRQQAYIKNSTRKTMR